MSLFDDMDALKTDTNFELKVKPLVVNVGVRRPKKEEFVRVCKGEAYQLVTKIYVDPEGQQYMVGPKLIPLLEKRGANLQDVALVLAINRQDQVFIWPLRQPGADGRDNPWFTSATNAAAEAQDHWITLINKGGEYGASKAEGDLGEPDWPEEEFNALLTMAFDGRELVEENDPIIQRIKGVV
jgi:hypothetical protein